jgi:four helix bundle protein
MTFSANALEDRTRQFAIDAILLTRAQRPSSELWEPFRQFVRAATSVGANHRAMSRARSSNEFAAKLQIVCEEVDEACYWLEVLAATLPDRAVLAPLNVEACELRAIFSKARATMRTRNQNPTR